MKKIILNNFGIMNEETQDKLELQYPDYEIDSCSATGNIVLREIIPTNDKLNEKIKELEQRIETLEKRWHQKLIS